MPCQKVIDTACGICETFAALLAWLKASCYTHVTFGNADAPITVELAIQNPGIRWKQCELKMQLVCLSLPIMMTELHRILTLESMGGLSLGLYD